jgi:large subunit ribosomal protein L29
MPSKSAELRELTDDQLLERAESAKEELFNLRFQLATGQLDNSSAIKKVRHEIARIATVMRERAMETDRELAATSMDAAVGNQAAEEES